MPVSPAVRYFISALIAVVVGYLVDAYLPLGTAAHLIAIVAYIVAAILVLLGIFALIRSGPVA